MTNHSQQKKICNLFIIGCIKSDFVSHSSFLTVRVFLHAMLINVFVLSMYLIFFQHLTTLKDEITTLIILLQISKNESYCYLMTLSVFLGPNPKVGGL